MSGYITDNIETIALWSRILVGLTLTILLAVIIYWIRKEDAERNKKQ